MAGKKELNILLGKLQSALGTVYTTMTTVEMVHVVHGWELTPRLTMTPVNLSSGTIGQEAAVPGDCPVDVKVSLYIVPTGSSTEPNVSPWLKSSGMTITTATSKHTFTPTSTESAAWTDMTLWKYSGDTASGESILTKAHSAMFDWELALEVGKPAILNFTGIGGLTSIGAGTLPTITSMPSSTSGVAFVKATTVTINGVTMILKSLNVQMKNTLKVIQDPTDTYGVKRVTITDRKTSFTAVVLEDTNSTNTPWTALLAGTAATVAVKFGTAANSYVSWQTAASKGFMDKVTCVEEDGINMYSIEGHVIDNNHTLVVNDA